MQQSWVLWKEDHEAVHGLKWSWFVGQNGGRNTVCSALIDQRAKVLYNIACGFGGNPFW